MYVWCAYRVMSRVVLLRAVRVVRHIRVFACVACYIRALACVVYVVVIVPAEMCRRKCRNRLEQ